MSRQFCTCSFLLLTKAHLNAIILPGENSVKTTSCVLPWPPPVLSVQNWESSSCMWVLMSSTWESSPLMEVPSFLNLGESGERLTSLASSTTSLTIPRNREGERKREGDMIEWATCTCMYNERSVTSYNMMVVFTRNSERWYMCPVSEWAGLGGRGPVLGWMEGCVCHEDDWLMRSWRVTGDSHYLFCHLIHIHLQVHSESTFNQN